MYLLALHARTLAHTYDQPTKQEAGSSDSHSAAAPATLATSERLTIATEISSLALSENRRGLCIAGLDGRLTCYVDRTDSSSFNPW
jgi:hypothetical protein